jgi:hypothetical protein
MEEGMVAQVLLDFTFMKYGTPEFKVPLQAVVQVVDAQAATETEQMVFVPSVTSMSMEPGPVPFTPPPTGVP